jgi:hypothetical protein
LPSSPSGVLAITGIFSRTVSSFDVTRFDSGRSLIIAVSKFASGSIE